MVKLNDVQDSIAGVVQKQPLVAVFFGGTSGIGQYTLRALAKAEVQGGKGFRAYVVGRNAKAIEDNISECRAIYPQGQFKFVQAEDLSLIQDVDRVCAEIIQLEEKESSDPRIDYLMMCQAGSIFLPRKDTKEGIDITMSLMYYSRMRIILKLLPLLLKSPLPAKVVSVYAAGTEAKLFLEDLSLRDLKHYSYTQARSHMVYMHTLFMEALAKLHGGKLSLIHIYPGLVMGPGYKNPELPLLFRILVLYFIYPLFGRLIAVSAKETGDRMLSLASLYYPPGLVDISKTREGIATGTDGKSGSGVYSLHWNGESNLKAKDYENFDKDKMREKVWNHTVRAFEVIEGGNVFTE